MSLLPSLRPNPWVLVAAVLVLIGIGLPSAQAADQPSPIQAAWLASGGASGPLGAATSPEQCGLPQYGGCTQAFQHGDYYWWPDIESAHYVLDGVLGDDWHADGALDGPLRYPIEDTPACPAGGRCQQRFMNGQETWTAAHGAHAVIYELPDGGRRPFGIHWMPPLDDQLGFPVDDVSCTSDGACQQTFEHGALHFVNDYGSTWAVLDGAIRTWWTAQGGLQSPIGAPHGDTMCGAGGVCAQDFARDGVADLVTWSATTGIRQVTDDRVATRWKQEGGVTDGLGAATGPALAEGDWRGQDFQRGSIYGIGQTAQLVRGAIRDEWGAWGRVNGLGGPVTEERCGLVRGGCSQVFGKGTVWWSSASGAKAVRYALADEYAAQGAQGGRLGYPVANEGCGKRNGGCSQEFQGGTELWSGATGAHTVYGALRDAYRAQGWESGRLGYPIANEGCGKRDGGCSQQFQGGTLFWSPATGAHATFYAFEDAYWSEGWENGRLGYPVADEACGKRDGGCAQEFQGGTLLLHPGQSRAVPVVGALRAGYAARGWENGRLGYPLSAGCTAPDGACAQYFQGGRLTWSPTAGAHAVLGAIARTFDPQPLGPALTDEACGKRDGGCSQEFEGGTVLWSPATGAHKVIGMVRDAYRAQGWENGRLGYPRSSPATDVPGQPRLQHFQGGSLDYWGKIDSLR